MNKAPARVRAGIVEIMTGPDAWAPADDVIIMGMGEADSEGWVLLGESLTHYITNTQIDAAFMLAKMEEIAGKLVSMGNIGSWVVSADGQVTGANPDAQQVANEAQAIANEIAGYKLR